MRWWLQVSRNWLITRSSYGEWRIAGRVDVELSRSAWLLSYIVIDRKPLFEALGA